MTLTTYLATATGPAWSSAMATPSDARTLARPSLGVVAAIVLALAMLLAALPQMASAPSTFEVPGPMPAPEPARILAR
jgi:hypothetical protein